MSLEWDERHLITRMSRWEKSEMKLRKRKKYISTGPTGSKGGYYSSIFLNWGEQVPTESGIVVTFHCRSFLNKGSLLHPRRRRALPQSAPPPPELSTTPSTRRVVMLNTLLRAARRSILPARAIAWTGRSRPRAAGDMNGAGQARHSEQ